MYTIVAENNTSDVLYDLLNNYHSKIKLIIKTSPQRFLDTEIIYINDTIETRVHRKKKKKYPYHGHQTSIKGIKELH